MSLAIWFWIVFAVWFFLGGYWSYAPEGRFRWGSWALFAVMLFLVGLQVFGSPVKH